MDADGKSPELCRNIKSKGENTFFGKYPRTEYGKTWRHCAGIYLAGSASGEGLDGLRGVVVNQLGDGFCYREGGIPSE